MAAVTGSGNDTRAVAATPVVFSTEWQPSQLCAPQDGYEIQIFGDIACSEAYDVANAYDLNGEKWQDLYQYTCYSGTVDILPTIFTCVSGGDEFTVARA